MDRVLLTTSEAAARLGVTAARIRQLVLGGDVQAEKVGRDVLIPAAEIEAAKKRKTKPGPIPQATLTETSNTALEMKAGEVVKTSAKSRKKKSGKQAGTANSTAKKPAATKRTSKKGN